MTFIPQNLVRVQEKGQVTLPNKIRRKLGIKKGDLVAVVETEGGILISPQEIVASKTLDLIGKVLKQKGLSLETLIESGREERGDLIEKYYGIRPTKGA